jgi:Na+-transporting NADH:ubiquinone oxidoreductase subunit F
MTPWMRKIHKWVGLLIGIQFVLWMASGVVMSLLDSDKVRGREWRIKPAAAPVWPATSVPMDTVLAGSRKHVQTISSGWLLDVPVYRLTDGKASWLVRAQDGKPTSIDAALAQQLAKASYSGSGTPATARLLNYTLETRAHKEPVWRVDFADADDTSVYVSAQTGNVLEHRNRTWRLFDIFWMLHIMDYAERMDFNNPLIIASATGGLWLALTGIWLLMTSFRLNEFIPRRWRGTDTVEVRAGDGSMVCAVTASAGDMALDVLARNGLYLPSNCGGGQSCGLCTVRVRGKAPAPTSADREHVSAKKLADGYRLACNLPVCGKLDLEVGDVAALSANLQGTIESVTPITPFLREIVIRPHFRLAKPCRPGSYIQVHIPSYVREAAQVDWPDHHDEDWNALALPEQLSNPTMLRRSYSVSLPPEQVQGNLTLLVRFLPGEQQLPPGKGASYLYTLKAGNAISFSGPFGDFALQPGNREKIFIGGGAGMAPLRAMIHSLLESGASETIHFWYGARSLRDAPYVDEMTALAAKHANFHWHLVVTGFVHDAVRDGLLQSHANLGECDFYLCGPPAMLHATRALLADMKVDEDRVAFDDFKV